MVQIKPRSNIRRPEAGFYSLNKRKRGGLGRIPADGSSRPGRAAFCKYDGRLLAFDDTNRKYFCPDCGYSPELEKTEFADPGLVTADGFNSSGTLLNSNAHKLRPIAQTNARRKMDKTLPENRYEGYDRDLQMLLDQGYHIISSTEWSKQENVIDLD